MNNKTSGIHKITAGAYILFDNNQNYTVHNFLNTHINLSIAMSELV